MGISMIIKKFTGKTEAEATEAAKKELGSTLVIMNVREVKRKGLFAFLLPRHWRKKHRRDRNTAAYSGQQRIRRSGRSNRTC